MTEQEKRGRKPIGRKALTDTEKKRRYRARQAARVEAAKIHNHTPVLVMVDNNHLEAFEELHQRWGGSRNDEFDTVIFLALKAHFELKTKRSKQEGWNEISGSQLIRTTAQSLFNKWEKQQ